MLQQDATFDRLQIAELRLGLEGVDATRPIRYGIPRPRIGSTMQRHLGPPADARRKPCAQPLQQSDLGNVSNRIPIGVEANTRREPDRSAEPAELIEPDVLKFSTFESTDLTPRDADRGAKVVLTQAQGDPGRTDLGDRVGRQPV